MTCVFLCLDADLLSMPADDNDLCVFLCLDADLLSMSADDNDLCVSVFR